MPQARIWLENSGPRDYDVERKSYFYLEGNNWRVGVSLPDNLNVRLGSYVTIGMDSDKPYTSFEVHKRQYQ